MHCEPVREAAMDRLPLGGGEAWPEPVTRHLEGCAVCRTELGELSRVWAALGQLPAPVASGEIEARLMRRIRWQRSRDAVLTVRGWVPAVLAAAVGVGISLIVSFLVPYSALVALCQEVLHVSDLHTAPYLLAGMAYGAPLALGAWILRRRLVSGALIGGLEASLLFFVILAPYMIAQCQEFAPVLRAAFLSGLGVGALGSSLAAFGLSRLAPLERARL